MKTTRTTLLAAALLLATACSSSTGARGTTSTTVAPQPATTVAAATVAPTPATTALAIQSWGTATFVVGGVKDFEIVEGQVTAMPDGRSQSRDGSFTYELVSGDPRVSGKVTGTWNSDRWGTGPTDGAMVQWGEATMTNAGGTWSGRWAGTMASPVGDMICRWWVGSGGYAGWTFYMWLPAKDISDPATQWTGLVYQGSPPTGF